LHPTVIVFNRQAYLFKLSQAPIVFLEISMHLKSELYYILPPSQAKHALELTILLIRAEHVKPVASLHLFVYMQA
jgi:hypothetical protein